MKILTILTALIGGFALFTASASAQPVGTHQEIGKGFSAYSTTTTNTVRLDDEKALLHIHDWGLFYTEDPASLLNQSRYDCFGTHLIDVTGESLDSRGYCAGIAANGDLWWNRWSGTLTGGDWSFTGGTGLFAYISGGGEWSSAAGFAPAETVTVWEGRWQWRE